MFNFSHDIKNIKLKNLILRWASKPIALKPALLALAYGLTIGMVFGMVLHSHYTEATLAMAMLLLTWWFNSYEDAT